MGWTKAVRLCLVIGGAVCGLGAGAGAGVGAAPTVQELLAEEEQQLIEVLHRLNERDFSLPADLKLDAPLREAASAMALAHLARARTLFPQWIAQERAALGQPMARIQVLVMPLMARLFNELAIWSIDSAGAAHNEAWLKAALAPAACRELPLSRFARRMAMVTAAPLELRPALLAGERELLSRWGTVRGALPTRPSADVLGGPDQAIVRLRAGLPVSAEPMSPFLAEQVFDRDRQPLPADRWDQCAISQWWLTNQLAAGKTEPMSALVRHRYALLAHAQELLPSGLDVKDLPGAPGSGAAPYPGLAAQFRAEGKIGVDVEVGPNGQPQKAQVVSRKLTVPGVRDNPPVAFETVFDDATLKLAMQRSYASEKGARQRMEFVWRLSE